MQHAIAYTQPQFLNILVVELLIGFQNVAVLLSLSSFSAFLNNYGRGDSLGTTICVKTNFWGKRGYAHCKMLLLQENVYVSVQFHGEHKTITKLR